MGYCGNQTLSITISCLEQLCFGRSTNCGGVGATSILISIFITGLIVAGISVAIHVTLHVWFYKPRMTYRRNGLKPEVHEYEDMCDEDMKTNATSIETKDNKAYQLKTTKNKK